jgi:F0F1-type ATP synthase membrane subunit b/b'
MLRAPDMQTGKTRTLLPLVAACCLPLAAVACDKSGADAQREADKAQAQSTTQITNAQVEADKKVAQAQHDFDMTREDYRHDMQAKLDDLDKKIADLDAKSKTDVGHAKAKLDANLPSIHAQRAAFGRDFASIQSDTAMTWDSSKARLDKEWDALKSAVDKAD